MKTLVIMAIAVWLACGTAISATTDDLIFLHHSSGQNWLTNSLNSALLAKSYIDERNDIYYGTDVTPDAGRSDSLAPTPGDKTNMNHWMRWFNDYLGAIKSHGCANGINKIVMFKSCFPTSNITADGTGGDPFSSTQTIANYKAIYRHPDGPGHTYSYGGHAYKPLEDIFAENPDTLFIPVIAPPRHYAPSDATNDTEAHRARLFNNWLKNDWLSSYNSAHPTLHNVAVFDWFNVLTYPDDHPTHPNRLKAEYGGTSGDSHPNSTANSYSTQVFATNADNFIDQAWATFLTGSVTYTLTVTNGSGDGQYDEGEVVAISADAPASGKAFAVWVGDSATVADTSQANTTVTMPAADVAVTAAYAWVYQLTVTNGSGDGQYRSGTVVDIAADAPPSGQIFDTWAGDTAGVANLLAAATTLTMPSAAVSVTATYVPVYRLTVNSGSGDGTYEQGTIVDVHADAPPSGEGFDTWTGDTAPLADANSPDTTVTMPAADTEITATYTTTYPGDLDGDGFVGQDDLDIVLDQWGCGDPPHDPIIDPRADANGDGFVGQDDLDIVLDDWGMGTTR